MSVLAVKRTANDAQLDEPAVPAKRAKKNKHSNYYEIFGADAVVDIEIRRHELDKKRQAFLYCRDFHSLLLWMLAECIAPSWIFVKHRALIEKVVIVQIEHLNESMIRALQHVHVHATHAQTDTNVNVATNSAFPFFDQAHYCPLQLDLPKFDRQSKHPSFKKLSVVAVDQIKGLSSTLIGRKKKKKKNTQQQQQQQSQSTATATDVFADAYKHNPEQFLLSLDEMLKHKFPVRGCDEQQQQRCAQFFQFPSRCPPSSPPPQNRSAALENMVAIDCEMVNTKNGIELARLSIVSERGECIYDELVKPDADVVDYCTKYSGITAEMLRTVTKRLNEVQIDMQRYVDASTIICGHGLENDLSALRMVHDRCIDTAILYPASSAMFKNKLKFLSAKFLKRDIQQSQQQGHNSFEDALAALDLVKLKLEHGPHYGLPKRNNFMSIFTMLKHCGRKSSLIGPTELFERIKPATPVSSIPTPSDSQSIQKAVKIIQQQKQHENGSSLVWVYLRPNHRATSSVTASSDADRNGETEEKLADDKEDSDAMKPLYHHLMALHEAAVCNTVFITVSGNKDLRALHQLREQAKAIGDADLQEAESIAQQLRNANYNVKQYPFWVFAKTTKNANAWVFAGNE